MVFKTILQNFSLLQRTRGDDELFVMMCRYLNLTEKTTHHTDQATHHIGQATNYTDQARQHISQATNHTAYATTMNERLYVATYCNKVLAKAEREYHRRTLRMNKNQTHSQSFVTPFLKVRYKWLQEYGKVFGFICTIFQSYDVSIFPP